MAVRQCLYLLQTTDRRRTGLSRRVQQKILRHERTTRIPYALDEMHELANQVVRSSVSVTGVQAKLSMDLQTYKETRKKSRFTIAPCGVISC